MFRDDRRCEVWAAVRQADFRGLRRLLPDSLLTEAVRAGGGRVAGVALNGVTLVWLAITAAREHTRSFADVLSLSVRILDLAASGPPPPVRQARRAARNGKRRSRRNPHGQDPAVVSEEAFVQARQRLPPAIWDRLLALLTAQFEDRYSHLTHWRGFRLLTLDGSTLNLPDDERLGDHFGTAANGVKRFPQARLTMLQFPLVRLPFRYELTPITEGERTVAARLLEHLGPGDLVLMDQGFWSYGLFHQVQAAGAFFGIRLPPHVRLRTLRRLGPRDRLVRWSMPTGPRWRGSGLPPTIDLRVIDYQLPGFRPSAVVTNVLNPRRLSREHWVHVCTTSEAGRPLDRRVRLRQGLYHRRWEIETTFHELKVTQRMETSLRSRTPASIRYEIHGHLVYYLLVRWLMVEAAQSAAPDGDPLGLSFHHACRELSTAWSLLLTATPKDTAEIVRKLLGNLAAHPVPFRPGRHVPRPNDTKTRNLGNGKSKQPHKLRVGET